MNLLRKYASILFLGTFLFPLLEKEVHAFQHKETFHCKATDKHFHEMEHICSICDFIVPVSTAPSQPDYDFSTFVSSSFLFCCHEAGLISGSNCFISLRAPPAMA